MTQEQFDWLIKKAEELMKDAKDPVHGWEHAKCAVENTKKIFGLLSKEQQSQVDEKIMIITAAWHDMSYTKYGVGITQLFWEGLRTVKIVRRYFKKVGVDKKEIDFVCDIIRFHVLSEFNFFNRFKSLTHKIVVDADMLENFNDKRIQLADRIADKSVFRTVLMKVLKPIFFNFWKKHRKFFLNLPEVSGRLIV